MKLSYEKPKLTIPLNEDESAYIVVSSLDMDIQTNLVLVQEHPEKMKELLECTVIDIKGVEYDTNQAATVDNIGKWPQEMVVDVLKLVLEKIAEASTSSELKEEEKN